MKRYTTIAFSILCFFSIVSCSEEFLDFEPEGKLPEAEFFVTEAHADQAVVATEVAGRLDHAEVGRLAAVVVIGAAAGRDDARAFALEAGLLGRVVVAPQALEGLGQSRSVGCARGAYHG